MMNHGKAIPDYYHFYEQANKNGLKYDIAIDNAIITQLTSYQKSLTSAKLKQATEQLIARKLSPDTFYGHLRVLVDCKILNKTDYGRGKGVLYSLTENAKMLMKLNLLGVNWEEIKLFTRIYEKFFLYEALHDPLLIVTSEQRFDALLSDLGVNSKDLEWGKFSDAMNYDSVDLVYKKNYASPRLKSLQRKDDIEYWRNRKNQNSVSEKIEFICFPLRQYNNLDVVIYRREHWKINKYLPSRIERTEYEVTIPGVSIRELVNDGGGNNTNTSFLQADVEEALDLLRQTGLIEPAIEFQGYMRYKIKDEDEHILHGLNLRSLMSILKAFYDSEFALLKYKWEHFQGPTSEERKRWTWLLGEREARRFFNDADIIRYEKRKCIKQCKNIEEYHQFLNNICSEEFSSPIYGPWPYRSIFDDFKIQEEKKQEEQRNQERKKRKKLWPKAKRTGGTKKELKENILKYEQYLTKKLEIQLERLPINLENEGIEDFRIMFSNTLQKYPFLQGFMKHICPRFFEHELTTEDLEVGRIYNETEKEKAEELYGVYNPVTRRRKRIVKRIPDITEKLMSIRKRSKKRNKI